MRIHNCNPIWPTSFDSIAHAEAGWKLSSSVFRGENSCACSKPEAIEVDLELCSGRPCQWSWLSHLAIVVMRNHNCNPFWPTSFDSVVHVEAGWTNTTCIHWCLGSHTLPMVAWLNNFCYSADHSIVHTCPTHMLSCACPMLVQPIYLPLAT